MLETSVFVPHEDYELALHFHRSVTELEVCQDNHQEKLDWEAWSEYQAEQAVERYLEDRGFWEAREEEEREMMMGVIPW